MTPSKKKLATDVEMLSTQINELEQSILTADHLNDSLQNNLTTARSGTSKKKITKLTTKCSSLETEVQELERENARLKKRTERMREELDKYATANWKRHVYGQQNSMWFQAFEQRVDY